MNREASNCSYIECSVFSEQLSEQMKTKKYYIIRKTMKHQQS